MKLQKNNRYFNIAAYAVISCLIVVLGIFVLLNFSAVWQWIRKIANVFYVLIEPLLIGVILAYLLDPIVGFYEMRLSYIKTHKKKFHMLSHKGQKKEKRWHMRTVPTLLTFLTVVCVLGLFVLMIQMNIGQIAGSFSLSSLGESLESYVAYFEDMIGGITQFTDEMGITKGQGLMERVYAGVNEFVVGVYNELSNGLLAIGIHAMNWLLAVVVAFYLLQDKEKILVFFKRLLKYILKGERYEKTSALGRQVDSILSGYIRGEIIDAIIITILTSGALILIRLDFAVIIGIIAGTFNLIPYFGPIVGLVLAVFIGILDANPMKAVYGAIAILIIQQIDGWFIVPKIVGDCVKLHPIVVLLAILIGGNLFGLIGMLIAVPVAALIRLLLVRHIPEVFSET